MSEQVDTRSASGRMVLNLMATIAQWEREAMSAAPYTSKALPPGMNARSFHAACRKLATQGDKRVRKLGKVWVAEREAIDVLPSSIRAKAVAGPWSPESALASVSRVPTTRKLRGVAGDEP